MTIAERILQVAVDRMEFIQPIEGYPIIGTVIQGVRRGTQSPKDGAIYVSIDELTPNDAMSHPGNPPVKGWDLVIRCSLIATPLETSTKTADGYRLQAYEALHKAMTTPPDWHKFRDTQDLAMDAYIEAPQMQRNAEQGQVGVHLLTRVKFRTSEYDPTVVRA